MIDISTCKRHKDGCVYGISPAVVWRVNTDNKVFTIDLYNDRDLGFTIAFDYNLESNTFGNFHARIITKTEFYKHVAIFKSKLKALNL